MPDRKRFYSRRIPNDQERDWGASTRRRTSDFGASPRTEMERRGDAEARRQQHVLAREAAEWARNTAEESRVAAENGRPAAAHEVSETLTTLRTVLTRMEAVQALKRQAKK